MNESETRADHIDPVLRAAGWGVVPGSVIRREFSITNGRLEGQGRRAKGLIADYILEYRNTKLAVLEAKAWDEPLTQGVAQAKDYANKLAIRFAYSSNGQGFYGIDMQEGAEGDLARFPTPEELWAQTFPQVNAWRDRFAAVPVADKSGSWQQRFYQEIAVNRVLHAVAHGKDRVLLTLATGTGKTSIAFQIAWKLYQSRWNLADRKTDAEPTRRPRILLLADRNTLAKQAYNDFTSFAAFPEDALVRVTPDAIRKKGRVPTNASVFFTIFQTFMSGPLKDGLPSPSFGEYPPDFFDFIIIDECHRGGSNDESSWRDILTYFTPAVQLGLTATPKRKDNVDTYAYFGEPVYVYSLKEGINDGFLTPFKVRQIFTTLDEYVYTPDDQLLEGEVQEGRRYQEADFNKIIEIKEREVKRVKIFMDLINQDEKTLVFCASQEHALAIRDLINQTKKSKNPDYCHRVTADDGELGEQHLKLFQDNERTIPTILTTSQKLSTGVDARNIRNIVLLRPVNSMIEFKQIIGRGTRLYEGKDYFTIYDFVKAHQHFSDPEWDGEPIDQTTDDDRPERDELEPQQQSPSRDAEEGEGSPRPKKIKVKLADGKARNIQHMMVTSFWHTDGSPMSAQQFLEQLYGKLPTFFRDEDELRAIWSDPDTRAKLLAGLAEQGFGGDQLAEMQKVIDAEQSDIFDVLAYVAFTKPTLTRDERAASAKVAIHAQYAERQQAFLDFVLAQYISVGVQELDREKLEPLLKLRYKSAIHDAIAELGEPEEIATLFMGFQKHLYEETVVA
jgi:type I restriction enzyme R subunit